MSTTLVAPSGHGIVDSGIVNSLPGKSTARMIEPGTVLDGKFRVERVLGEGAMGLVVEATHIALDERVALKFLHDEARERPDIASRFAREARAAAKIKNDHVARVYDVGGTQDGAPFIVMEYLDGDDLERLLAKRGRLDPSEAVDYVIQACEGLAAAHASGIVHRDIKPANLFIAESTGVRGIKIVDFGISKAALKHDEIDVDGPNTTQLMGSPHYMSPEQVRSTKDVDARADIWSLGVVLFELLTCETPFVATEVTAIIAMILHEEPRRVREVRPELPEGLDAIIQRCLSKDVNERWQNAAELAVALLPFAPKRSRAVAERASAMAKRSSGALAIDSLPPPPSSVSTPTSTQPNPRASTIGPVAAVATPAPKKSPIGLIAGALVLVAFAVGGTALTLGRTPKPAATPETANANALPPPTEMPSGPAVVATPEPTPAALPAPSSSEAVAASAASPRVTPGVAPRVNGVARAVAKGSAAAPAASPTPESEIRHER